MKISDVLFGAVTVVSVTFSIAAQAGSLACEMQLNQALQANGHAPLSPDKYILRLGDGSWQPLENLTRAEELARDAKAKFQSDRTELRDQLIALLSKDSENFLRNFASNRYLEMARSSSESLTVSGVISKYSTEDLSELYARVTNAAFRDCKFQADEDIKKSLAAIAEARAACKTADCSPSVIVALQTREHEVRDQKDRLDITVQNCRTLKTEMQTFAEANKKVADRLRSSYAPQVVSTVLFEHDTKAKEIKACLEKYRSSEDSRKVAKLTETREKLSKACGEDYPVNKVCEDPLAEIDAKIRKIDAGSACGRTNLNDRFNLDFNARAPGFSIDLGRFPVAVFRYDGRASIQLDLRSCLFVGDGRYDHKKNVVGPAVQFKTMKELSRYNSECDSVNWFSADYKKKKCEEIEKLP